MVLFVHITSRTEGEPHPNLLSEKGGRGFPYLAFLDARGNLLAAHSGERTVENFRVTLAEAQEFEAFLARTDRTAEEEHQLFVKETTLLRVTPEEAQARLAGMSGLTEEQATLARQAVADLEIRHVLMTLTWRSTPEDWVEVGSRLWAMHGEGKTASDARQRQYVWGFVLQYGEARKDVAAMEAALADMHVLLEGNPRAASYFTEWEGKLEAVRAALAAPVEPPAAAPNAAPPGG